MLKGENLQGSIINIEQQVGPINKETSWLSSKKIEVFNMWTPKSKTSA